MKVNLLISFLFDVILHKLKCYEKECITNTSIRYKPVNQQEELLWFKDVNMCTFFTHISHFNMKEEAFPHTLIKPDILIN